MSTPISLLGAPAVHRRLAGPAAAGLLAIAAVHLIDGPGSLHDTAYVGLLELLLTAACAPLAALLLVRPLPALWRAAAVLAGLALAAYVASRTVGLPGATDDIGNWRDPLGIINVAAELVVLGVAAGGLRPTRARP